MIKNPFLSVSLLFLKKTLYYLIILKNSLPLCLLIILKKIFASLPPSAPLRETSGL
ncbi:hypothetical protein SAMN05660909_02876 [Chitinophaga terrae (ex Kim and Jung 2007)]|uniref:Uncharacterized protein n=1 Tax=Chitinophaga terrae (ex Kim and Jung 2007) TaxID=408074 RepID=A0A1H4D0I6_9BACT|nr:hypothetical protein SAMN05660909_02876 [Chitinophaga terrae (ex Kim and Jung 2007)]